MKNNISIRQIILFEDGNQIYYSIEFVVFFIYSNFFYKKPLLTFEKLTQQMFKPRFFLVFLVDPAGLPTFPLITIFTQVYKSRMVKLILARLTRLQVSTVQSVQ